MLRREPPLWAQEGVGASARVFAEPWRGAPLHLRDVADGTTFVALLGPVYNQSSPPQHPSIRHIEHTIHDANLVNAVAGVSAVGFYAAYLMRSESTQLAHAVLRDFCCRCLSQIGTPLEQVLGMFDLPFAGVGVFGFLVYLFLCQNEAPSL